MQEITIDDNTLIWYALVDGKAYGNCIKFTKDSFPYAAMVGQAIGDDIKRCFEEKAE